MNACKLQDILVGICEQDNRAGLRGTIVVVLKSGTSFRFPAYADEWMIATAAEILHITDDLHIDINEIAAVQYRSLKIERGN